MSLNTFPVGDRQKIKLLVLDIDGTISGISNQVRQPVIEAIAKVKQQGIPVAVATGRMFCSALRFYEAIGAGLPLICYNGALIQDPETNKVHHHFPISIPLAGQILDFLEQPQYRDQMTVHFYIDDCLHVQDMGEDTRKYLDRTSAPIRVVDSLRERLTVEPTKILALSENLELIEELSADICATFPQDKLHFTKSSPNFFEITHPLANKGFAVQYLAETVLGLKSENVMAIGDNFNDLEMIEYAGIGVAMGNAPAPIQRIADWIAPSIEEDGVVTALAQILNGGIRIDGRLGR
ncbi:MAG: HAD family phosphatase [Roseofilum sp. SBFL]|uniref:Cof-type HAD-IIB family hydrolase n=1 Tax=unclassified Roseofilum TaxID=2620099 RepID=UPI001B2325CD|nr:MULTISPECIES: Cof-type HAD-IIB family hydrolase [unclassified Roseofilum]MBP0013184.1 HAD family phosphatase [Roseofilum sp. SID3]MBP0023239.1 HAD family phosphatase [Roseofilum sp. SID2]MBP0039398.1 HAD family phosphatase [Roseofilum sp. SID1]MBP0044079.1 HAD family phosphatase [Roseofilum sp. SBFL]